MKNLLFLLPILLLSACSPTSSQIAPEGDFACGTDKVSDSDGNEYQTAYFDVDGGHDIEKEGQCWMAENLNVGKVIINPGDEPTDDGVIEKWCMTDDWTATHDSDCDYGWGQFTEGSHCDKRDKRLKGKEIKSSKHYCDGTGESPKYGALYSWSELKKDNPESIKGACPEGWQLPTIGDFATLRNSIEAQLPPYENPKFSADIADRHEDAIRDNISNGTFNAPLAGLYTNLRYENNGDSVSFWARKENSNSLNQNCYLYISTYQQGGPGGVWRTHCTPSDSFSELARNPSLEFTGRYARCILKKEHY